MLDISKLISCETDNFHTGSFHWKYSTNLYLKKDKNGKFMIFYLKLLKMHALICKFEIKCKLTPKKLGRKTKCGVFIPSVLYAMYVISC